MTRKEVLFAEYEKVKNKVSSITLFIHMPTGETEIISNPRVLEKMWYIDKTYNDELVHSNCDKIQIENYVFETQEDTMDFGSAILNLKEGHKVARKGWNGKEMYLTLIPAGNAMFQHYPMQNCIGMKTADNKMQPGWVPSQTDMLAEDWIIVK